MKKIINIIKFLFILLIFLSPSLLGQQEQIRIMAYNLLEYWNNGDNVFRDTYFRDIINATTPDIISAIEFNTSTDTKPIGFLNSVLNNSTANLYKMGTFIADIDYLTSEIHSDANVIYYKPSKFTFLSSKLIIADNQPSGTNHPSYEYQLYNNLTGNKIIIYGVHFTSGGSGGASLRNDNATTIRSYSDVLPSGSFFVIAGDFNFFNGGNEPAFTTLLSGTTGKFIDPLNLPSNDNWSSYHAVHTLSTRSSSFGGSVENYGLKFRSDLILNSQAIVDPGGVTYNSSSYITYGNDGNHYSSSINSGTNSAVSSTIADALYYASDHLPVYADYTFEIPNTINPPYPGGIVFTQVGVDDGNGNNFIEFMTLYRMNLQSLKITSNPVQSNGTISGGNYFDLSNTPSTWADVPGGTFVRLGENLINDNDAGDRILQYDGANSGTLPNLTSESNQLIAYTGSATTPTYYIAAIHWGDTQGWTTSSNAPFDTPSSSSIALTASASDNWFYNSSVSGNLYTTRNSLTAPGNWSTT